MALTPAGATAAAAAKTGGRPQFDWAGHVFLRECHENEDKTRLRWWVKTRKYREAAAAETGESRTIQVMRNRIMGAVPYPSEAFEKVLDMKPANYRRRCPPDYTESRLHEVVERLGLFTDPFFTEVMFPVPDDVRLGLYNGVSLDGGGRRRYLKERYRSKPECRYHYAPSSGHRHGFRLSDFIIGSEIKNPEYGRRRLIEDTFYSRNKLPDLDTPLSESSITYED